METYWSQEFFLRNNFCFPQTTWSWSHELRTWVSMTWTPRFWTGPMEHVQCLWVSPGSLFTLQSPSRWLNLNTWAQPATKPQYLDTSVHVQHCSVQCTWLNRQAQFGRDDLLSAVPIAGQHWELCTTVCDLLCVHDSGSSSTGGVRSCSVDWIAPCGARNTSRQKIRFLKGRLTPIDGDDDEGRWSYCISKAAHIRGGGTTIPSWLKGSIGVCVHGEESPALYHNMRANRSTKDLHLSHRTVNLRKKVWLKQQSSQCKLKIVQC